ncbi:hypothetical protein [Natrinema sp. DC36]|nr:hypothetical protein [Natrinema sp. DC36]
MTDSSDGAPTRCPNCDAAIPERDPLVGWWLCDDCAIAVTDAGERMT